MELSDILFGAYPQSEDTDGSLGLIALHIYLFIDIHGFLTTYRPIPV